VDCAQPLPYVALAAPPVIQRPYRCRCRSCQPPASAGVPPNARVMVVAAVVGVTSHQPLATTVVRRGAAERIWLRLLKAGSQAPVALPPCPCW